jgi:hypothetical protein
MGLQCNDEKYGARSLLTEKQSTSGGGRCPHPSTVSNERLNDPRRRIVVQRFIERGQALADSVGVASDGRNHQVNELTVRLFACRTTLAYLRNESSSILWVIFDHL